MKRHSTSRLSGKQVDGLPLVCHAKPQSSGPEWGRAPVTFDYEKLFQSIILSTSCLGSRIVVLRHELKLRIDFIRQQNDNTTEFYRVFPKSTKSVVFPLSKKGEHIENKQNGRGNRSSSTSYSRGNQVDGLPRAAILVRQSDASPEHRDFSERGSVGTCFP